MIQDLTKPQAPKAPSTRKFSLPDGKIQDQQYVSGEWQDVGEPYFRRDPLVFADGVTPDGDPVRNAYWRSDLTSGGPARPIEVGRRQAKPPTELQTRSAAFARRMEGAEENMLRLTDQGFDPVNFQDYMASQAPFGAANWLVSSEHQQYQQAAQNFISGILRLDSGAAVPEEEFQRYFAQYFPIAGDTPETVAQKAATRRKLVQDIRDQSQGAYERIYGETPIGGSGGGQASKRMGLRPEHYDSPR